MSMVSVLVRLGERDQVWVWVPEAWSEDPYKAAEFFETIGFMA